MLETTAQLGKSIFDGVWALFGITVPGFDFTFGQMYVGIIFAGLSILVVKFLFGFGGSGGSRYRSGSTRNPRISPDRINDEF